MPALIPANDYLMQQPYARCALGCARRRPPPPRACSVRRSVPLRYQDNIAARTPREASDHDRSPPVSTTPAVSQPDYTLLSNQGYRQVVPHVRPFLPRARRGASATSRRPPRPALTIRADTRRFTITSSLHRDWTGRRRAVRPVCFCHGRSWTTTRASGWPN